MNKKQDFVSLLEKIDKRVRKATPYLYNNTKVKINNYYWWDGYMKALQCDKSDVVFVLKELKKRKFDVMKGVYYVKWCDVEKLIGEVEK